MQRRQQQPLASAWRLQRPACPRGGAWWGSCPWPWMAPGTLLLGEVARAALAALVALVLLPPPPPSPWASPFCACQRSRCCACASTARCAPWPSSWCAPATLTASSCSTSSSTLRCWRALTPWPQRPATALPAWLPCWSPGSRPSSPWRLPSSWWPLAPWPTSQTAGTCWTLWSLPCATWCTCQALAMPQPCAPCARCAPCAPLACCPPCATPSMASWLSWATCCTWSCWSSSWWPWLAWWACSCGQGR